MRGWRFVDDRLNSVTVSAHDPRNSYTFLMTKPSPAGPRSVSIMLRVTPEAAEWIDSQRGDAPRAEFVRRVLMDRANARPLVDVPKPVPAEELGLVMGEVLDTAGYTVVRKSGG